MWLPFESTSQLVEIPTSSIIYTLLFPLTVLGPHDYCYFFQIPSCYTFTFSCDFREKSAWSGGLYEWDFFGILEPEDQI